MLNESLPLVLQLLLSSSKTWRTSWSCPKLSLQLLSQCPTPCRNVIASHLHRQYLIPNANSRHYLQKYSPNQFYRPSRLTFTACSWAMKYIWAFCFHFSIYLERNWNIYVEKPTPNNPSYILNDCYRAHMLSCGEFPPYCVEWPDMTSGAVAGGWMGWITGDYAMGTMERKGSYRHKNCIEVNLGYKGPWVIQTTLTVHE